MMPEWPLATPIWSSLVIDKDVGFERLRGATQCIGCCAELGEAHAAPAHRTMCWRLRARQKARMSFIAWCHAKGKHPLTDIHVAARALAWRDALIEDLGAHGMLDREMFKRLLTRSQGHVDGAAKHRQQFTHLDAGWDGRGFPPSLLASINDCVMATGGYSDPIFDRADLSA